MSVAPASAVECERYLAHSMLLTILLKEIKCFLKQLQSYRLRLKDTTIGQLKLLSEMISNLSQCHYVTCMYYDFKLLHYEHDTVSSRIIGLLSLLVCKTLAAFF